MDKEQSYEDIDTSILEKWEKVREYLEPKIEDAAKSMENLGIDGIARYLTIGGKMFRGFLTVLFAESLGASLDYASDAAVAIEMVHAASLAIDDIVDKDTNRRGKLSGWIIYGIGKTALTALLLVPVAQRVIEKYGFDAIRYSIKSWEAMVRGEILDAYASLKLNPSEYMNVIKLKTASLFSLSAVLGVIAAKNNNLVDNAEFYGDKLGIAYQLADDIGDYYSYLIGKKEKLDPGEVLFEKYIMHRYPISERGDEIIKNGMNILNDVVNEASNAIVELPESKQKSMLSRIPYFMVNKMLESVGLTLKRF
ncbi:geranylgeranyl pyrophosphate synthase [Caldisphaera lagunensis DSM 15908]|uniref:Geranylgeranyl pyrophosphate synthase n=1 Tax=Caldisphaera lagunensis (strain DSM 15908 / JCM 11604 / ANMR 0165 / IC-154) TaxID=1056495 RepID=L0AB91_CALLD|nr:polyprenyl synthetase family protein [Caldisphaera lagunensis]AFZ71126.1 geranylgeranyl pyrophosphate synthase [Caldisphaera lagunensis DSM 15908]